MPDLVQIPRYGGPEVLRIVSQSRLPAPNQNEIKIRVSACGVNFADLMMRMGLYPEAPKLPFVPGYEIAGEVVEVGSGATSLAVGDKVLATCRFGGYSNEIILQENQVRKIPAGLTDIEAASIPVNFVTAWIALHDLARIRPGEHVLVRSAAGGVGIAAIQLARNAGAKVAGIVSTQEKAKLVLSLGAEECFLQEDWDLGKVPERFDCILENSGGKSLKYSYSRLAPLGRIVSFGATDIVGGKKRSILRTLTFLLRTPFFTPLRLAMDNRGVFGLNILSLSDEPEKVERALDQVLAEFERGVLRTFIGKTFPLHEAAKAHLYLLDRRNMGKVVLTC